MVKMRETVDSNGASAEGDVTVKCRSSKPPGVDGSQVAEQGKAGLILGILKKWLRSVLMKINGDAVKGVVCTFAHAQLLLIASKQPRTQTLQHHCPPPAVEMRLQEQWRETLACYTCIYRPSPGAGQGRRRCSRSGLTASAIKGSCGGGGMG